MAFGLAATKLKPGGDISAFCDAPTATSTFQSSMRKSVAAREATASTMNSAGCEALSMASRTAATSLVMPVAVSVCTMRMALKSCALSARKRSSTACA